MPNLLKYLALFTLFIVNSAWAEAEWRTWYQQNNLTIEYQRQPSGVIAIRAQAHFPLSTRHAFINLLNDTQRGSEWISKVKQVQLITRPSPAQSIVYSEFNAPWPVRDRVMLTHSCYKKIDNNTSVLLVKSVNQEARPKYLQGNLSSKKIFIDPVIARWHLKDTAQGLYIEHYLLAKPNGSLPYFLTNKMALKSMRSTFRKMGPLLSESGYSNSPIQFAFSACSGFEK